MKKTRPLTHEDLHIWNRVSRTVRPLIEKMSQADLEKALGVDFRKSHIHFPPTPKPILHKTRTDLQTRSDKKTRKGKIEIDKKIDLHDLTRDEAFPLLMKKLHRAYNSGARCVLVVTGKGTNLEGVLRMSLPAWLADAQVRPIIASFAPAHIRHGGAGAFYVFLKRNLG